MKRAFAFVQNLDESFFAVAGRPSIEVLCDVTEVSFNLTIMRSLWYFHRGDYDSIRLTPNGDTMTLVYIFEND